MSASGAPAVASFDASAYRVGIVASNWHQPVMDGLIGGAQRALSAHQITTHRLLRVPGAFELAVVAAELSSHVDVVVALGVVIRGGTPHFDYVCHAVTEGLTRVSLDRAIPIGFGVLTCDTEAQALDRAGLEATAEFAGSSEDKGFEATAAALQTARVLEVLRMT